MKTKTILTLCLTYCLLIVTPVFAQVKGVAQYSVNWKSSVDNKEHGKLLFSDVKSYFFPVNENNESISPLNLHSTNSSTSSSKKRLTVSEYDPDALSIALSIKYKSFHTQGYPFYIFVDIDKKEAIHFVEYQPDSLLSIEQFQVTEPLNILRWVIEDDFKDIGNFSCQKASTWFRGRNYIAWFTHEIPVTFGPWKLNGLPGLIVYAYDLSGEVVFKLEELNIGNNLFEDDKIFMFELNNQIALSEFIPTKVLTILREHGDDQYRALESKMSRDVSFSTSSFQVEWGGIEKDFEFLNKR
jgi:GLPGLI family protein